MHGTFLAFGLSTLVSIFKQQLGQHPLVFHLACYHNRALLLAEFDASLLSASFSFIFRARFIFSNPDQMTSIVITSPLRWLGPTSLMKFYSKMVASTVAMVPHGKSISFKVALQIFWLHISLFCFAWKTTRVPYYRQPTTWKPNPNSRLILAKIAQH